MTTKSRLWLLFLICGCGSMDGTSRCNPPQPSLPSSGYPYQACVDYINSLRACVGLRPLVRWTSAESCADSQAQSDSQTGKFHGAFGTCQEWSQDECPAWGSTTGQNGIVPGCLDAMWREGPGGGHYDNMTSASSTMVACGFYTTSDGAVWSVQDFR